MIFIHFVIRTSKNHYPQVFLEECKYIVKEKKMPEYITHDMRKISKSFFLKNKKIKRWKRTKKDIKILKNTKKKKKKCVIRIFLMIKKKKGKPIQVQKKLLFNTLLTTATFQCYFQNHVSIRTTENNYNKSNKKISLQPASPEEIKW